MFLLNFFLTLISHSVSMSANLGKLLILVGWNVNRIEPNLQPNQDSIFIFILRSLQNKGFYKSKKNHSQYCTNSFLYFYKHYLISIWFLLKSRSRQHWFTTLSLNMFLIVFSSIHIITLYCVLWHSSHNFHMFPFKLCQYSTYPIFFVQSFIRQS
jgi:hypothetical protein